MKKRILISIFIMVLLLSACSKDPSATSATKNGKPLIVIYGDYKCPYCKKTERQVMPKLRDQYIDNKKAEYQFVNLAFLGKDSIIGSRAGHAVQQYAPQQYLDFQHNVFKNQQDESKKWITESVMDKEIDRLDISDDTKDKIKKAYKTKDSDAWKAAEKDKKIAKENHVDTTPTAFVGGKKVEDPYDFDSYDKLLKDQL